MTQFNKNNIESEWWDLVEEFPEFILEISPEVRQWYEEVLLKNDSIGVIPNESDLCNLRYGFECGIGWKGIIREYFGEIRKLIETAKTNGDEIFYKTFIFKEKFGELRDQGDFYGKNYKEYWDDYLKLSRNLQYKSSTICELCGNVAELRKRSAGMGWLKCLCDNHFEEWKHN